MAGTDRSIASKMSRSRRITLADFRMSSGRIGGERAFFAAEPPGSRTAVTSARSRSIRTTGAVTVDRYAAVDDFGRLINPLIVNGQVHGALAQGIGQARQRAHGL